MTVCCLLAGALIFTCAVPGRASGPDDSTDAELKRQTAEVERLRKELDQQEAELKRLKQENERLRKEKTPPAAAAPTVPAALKPVPPIATLPALTTDAVIEAAELAGHFVTEPDAAAQRYHGKRFKVRGEVLRFSRGLVTRDYGIILATGDPATTVVCNFRFAEWYVGVYPKGHGGELVARLEGGHETTLARAGQSLTVIGKCRGLKDGAIILTGCEFVR